jgi:hypothetical protein
MDNIEAHNSQLTAVQVSTLTGVPTRPQAIAPVITVVYWRPNIPDDWYVLQLQKTAAHCKTVKATGQLPYTEWRNYIYETLNTHNT